ncbi:MAG: hypothetical protein ACI9DC_005093, partial [Gammaproteobacteria bacterium]
MKSFDVVKHIGLACIQRRVLYVVDSLSLKHPEEAFASRIVTAMTNGTHGAQQCVSVEKALIVATAKLTA